MASEMFTVVVDLIAQTTATTLDDANLPAAELRAGAGIARDDFPAADESKTALVSDGLSDAPRLRYITNLHTCPVTQFLRRKSIPVFHPRAAAARSASSQSVMPHQRRNRPPGAAA